MITVKDIAKELNLSQSTVSIVLRGEGDNRKISKETQMRVWETARKLGYQVNISARKLKAVDTTIYIAVYWTIDYRASYMIHFFDGLWEAAKEYDKKIEFIIKPYADLKDSFEIIASYHAAIICNADEKEIRYLESIKCLFPIILYNRNSEYYDTVCVNDEEIGSMASQILGEEECQKVLFVTSPVIYEGMKALHHSFWEGMKGKGKEVIEIESEDSPAGGKTVAEQYLTLYHDAKGIFFTSANIALACLNSLVRSGVDIPSECKLITVSNGNWDQEESAVVSLSVIDNQRKRLAAKCLMLAIERIEDNQKGIVSETVDPVFIRRESC